jgi:DNA repair exonuclease SbcCD ATPase subunit
MVLDEPCAAWDEERLAGAHRAFAALARAGRQVVVLSADERLAGWEATWERLTAASPGNEEGHRRAA